jgi:hypothetical protein
VKELADALQATLSSEAKQSRAQSIHRSRRQHQPRHQSGEGGASFAALVASATAGRSFGTGKAQVPQVSKATEA